MIIKKIAQSSGVVATVVDNLTSTSATNALSANQGKVLNDKQLVLLYSGTPIVSPSLGTLGSGTLSESSANFKELIFVVGQTATECAVFTMPIGYVTRSIFDYMALSTFYARGYLEINGTTVSIMTREIAGYTLSQIGILRVYGRKA